MHEDVEVFYMTVESCESLDEMTIGPVTWTVAADTNGVAIRATKTRSPILKKGLHSIRSKLEFHPIKLLCYSRR